MSNQNEQGSALQFASAYLRHDPDIALAAVTKYGMALEHVPEQMRDNRTFVLMAVSQTGIALEFASPRIQDDKELAMVACGNRGNALEFASERLRKDRDVAHAAVAQNGLALQFVDDELLEDAFILFVAVSQIGYALHFVPDHMKSPRLLLAACTNDGNALEFCTEQTETLASVAVAQTEQALRFVDPAFKKNRHFILMAIAKHSGKAFAFADDAMKQDRFMSLVAVRRDGTALKFCSPSIRDDKAIVQAAVEDNPRALEFASDRLRDDIDVVITALSTSAEFSLQFSSPKWQTEGGRREVFLEIQQRLFDRETFVTVVLGAIDSQKSCGVLTMLSMGKITKQIKMQIADYAGVPYGRGLSILAQAGSNAATLFYLGGHRQGRRVRPRHHDSD
jgi:hypothetical protein